MRAWQVTDAGEPRDVLSIAEVPDLVAGPGDVVVRMRGAALNFPDVLLCRGAYQERPAYPFTPGIEVCGEVLLVGDGVEGIAVGDRVLGGARLPQGAYAEQAVMPAHDVFRAPAALDDAEAAALFVAYQTGWAALHRRAAIQPGETLLVHAAAGGVGSAAVQLGKLAGATVVGVVGGADKVGVARSMGADVVVDRSEQDFVEVVKDLTGGRGADVVFDPVGGDSFRRSTKCIAFEGRIVVVGFASGDIPTAALNHALVKNYSILGLHWGLYRTRALPVVVAAYEELHGLAEAGSIRPLVSERLPFEALPDGLERLGAGTTVGRLVLMA